jgi:SAM-dependent methyltransferase
MPPDVVDLRSFYTSPLGRVAHRFIGRMVRQRWPDCTGQSILGIGYATPYLGLYRDAAVRVLALMPAEQGVVNWPESGISSTALADITALPLPDACIDRVLLAHVLEYVELPRELLSEVWRILTPGGRVIIVAPNRRGLWSRVDTTPFGYGQPYSKSQLRELLRETLFSPEHWAEALYVPPFARPSLLRLAGAFERFGRRFALPGAGIHLVEATKQVYRPIGIRKAVRRLPQLQPAAIPTAGTALQAPSSRDS